MSIVQVARILWAHRVLTILTTAGTLVGALIAVLIVPPSYQGTTRVMLNTLKPDPVTGEVIPTNSAKTFITTQRELVRDVSVAGSAAEALGWLSDPQALEAYDATNNGDVDLRRAMAQRIIDRTDVNVVSGTNILEIVFRARSPDDARRMANALRDAYIETTLSSRRREATRNADWYAQQAAKEREMLETADAAKTAYERESGIVMQDPTVDGETARLRALASQGVGAVVAPPITMGASPSALQLAQVDAQIAQAGKTLGPNHPSMIQMKAQREALAKLAAEDQAAMRAAGAAGTRAAAESASAVSRAVSAQTSRVIANRDKIERLMQLQGQVNLHRSQMEKALARASELRQEAAVADSGIAVLSEAVTPQNPSFPNNPLIFGGALGLGGAIGLFLSLLLELLRRRVRGVEDVAGVAEVPLLAVVSADPAIRRSQRRVRISKAPRPKGREAAAA
jgi:uncharacterized protein involved in exopolysaccharide biosynthesis